MSAIPQAVFDADAYKQTTRQQWDKAADAWHRWGPLLSKWLGPATEQMLDMADLRPGSRVLERSFSEAGFKDVETVRVDAPVMLDSAAECLRFEKESFGALHQMLAGLDSSDQASAWVEIETALEAFEDESGFSGPCEMVIAVGTK
jgi:hypothetical protein